MKKLFAGDKARGDAQIYKKFPAMPISFLY
jgi:hypothetical protein